MTIAPDMYSRIIAAKMYIDENFQESIDLDRISREACISRFHFHRLFTQVYHQTPHRYLTQKRINLAIKLLKEEEITVREVCSSIGFESMGSFSVLFKKVIGSAPHCYRRKAKKILNQTREQPAKFIPGCFLNSFG
jgi:AraC-like DNA-binding protein